MKLKVSSPEERPERVVRLRLEEAACEPGALHVAAVDENGKRVDRGVLLVIRADGVYRCVSVNEILGFALDKNGRVKDITS